MDFLEQFIPFLRSAESLSSKLRTLVEECNTHFVSLVEAQCDRLELSVSYALKVSEEDRSGRAKIMQSCV